MLTVYMLVGKLLRFFITFYILKYQQEIITYLNALNWHQIKFIKNSQY